MGSWGHPRRSIRLACWGEVSVREGALRPCPDYDDAWLLPVPSVPSAVFDIGANQGYDALLVLLSGGQRQVVLVEANPAALARAAENLIRNGVAHRRASSPPSRATFRARRGELLDGGDGCGRQRVPQPRPVRQHLGELHHRPHRHGRCAVRAVSGGPGVGESGRGGGRGPVLAGSAECAAAARTCFVVEMHSNPNLSMADNARAVLEWCRAAGYRPWYLAEHSALECPEQIQHWGRVTSYCSRRRGRFPSGWLCSNNRRNSRRRCVLWKNRLPCGAGTERPLARKGEPEPARRYPLKV